MIDDAFHDFLITPLRRYAALLFAAIRFHADTPMLLRFDAVDGAICRCALRLFTILIIIEDYFTPRQIFFGLRLAAAFMRRALCARLRIRHCRLPSAMSMFYAMKMRKCACARFRRPECCRDTPCRHARFAPPRSFDVYAASARYHEARRAALMRLYAAYSAADRVADDDVDSCR